eukprot:gene29644-18284_t
MADKNAPPSKLACIFRTLLCATGSVKFSKVKATKPKVAWAQQSDHDHKCPNVVVNQVYTSGDGGDKCPTPPTSASGKTQMLLELEPGRASPVSWPLPSAPSELHEPANSHVSDSFGGISILDDPSFHTDSQSSQMGLSR